MACATIVPIDRIDTIGGQKFAPIVPAPRLGAFRSGNLMARQASFPESGFQVNSRDLSRAEPQRGGEIRKWQSLAKPLRLCGSARPSGFSGPQELRTDRRERLLGDRGVETALFKGLQILQLLVRKPQDLQVLGFSPGDCLAELIPGLQGALACRSQY